MPGPTSTRAACFALLTALLTASERARAQEELGHKLLGTLGLEAGSSPKPGIYLTNTVVSYHAGELVDRDGHTLPVDLDLDAVGGALGVTTTFAIPHLSASVTAAGAVPVAHVSAHTKRPDSSIDRFGLGDLYLMPLKLGWRRERVEIVSDYALYVPIGGFEPGGNDGIGRGQWTHEISLGGTVYFDPGRTWHLSVLASYDWNSRKRSIDITRGATLQAQGGAGKKLFAIVNVGLAAYALWQVTDDTGSALPDVLRGARDRAYGLGPEIDLDIKAIRGRLTARYEQDVAVASRPTGRVLLVSWTAVAWRFGGAP